MPKIVTVEQMRAIEKAADAQGHSYTDMMEMAGHAVAERVYELVMALEEPRIAILVGPGNNGGDGLVAGRVLAEELPNAHIGAFLLAARGEDDQNFVRARDAGVFIAEAESDSGQGYRVLQNLVANADVVIDALFGTSLRLPIKGDAAKVLQAAHKALTLRKNDRPQRSYATPADPAEDGGWPSPVIVAVDAPSGLDCDTGELDAHTLVADETITFAAAKPGLLAFPGAAAVGTLHVANIGLPARLPELDEVQAALVDVAWVAACLPERGANSHKGTFGKLMVTAGSLNYIGAAYLVASAAYRIGTGLVTVAAPQILVPTLAGMIPEATWLLLPHDMGVINEAAVKVLRKELGGASAMVLGPGLGHEDVTADFLRALLTPREDVRRARPFGFVVPDDAPEASTEDDAPLPPLVIDADGLNLLAGMDDWSSLLPPGTILTPHPGEFGRLAGLETAEVQANRLALAREKAAEWNCIVVLKGAHTVIATPEGWVAVQPFATAALAKAGTGDVLSGTIAGLLAQGLAPYDAAVAGTWLHGLAGVRAGEALGTTASVTASDVLEALPEAYAIAEAAKG
ncbi:NAD(P)H-hydrate dehydratase [Aggregatilinea lenta]|uniref:NAD(P)H-hydrate dehydratase n=1 Tax=Aggregatilinea lenta TaxID=913108 RepID=UPI000E5B92FA|nr:NAD(P)H-hydrate dehydratase [Aggregatilinea lenta]